MWAIYYDDETRFGSADGAWSDAPVDGVIFVVERQGDRVLYHSGCDFYVQFPDDDSIASTGEIGPILRYRPAFRTDAIKLGRWTSHAKFERISKRAREEWR